MSVIQPASDWRDMDAQPNTVNAMTSNPMVMTDMRFMAISSPLRVAGSHLARGARGRRAGEAAEDGARDEPGAARVIEVEDPADHLTGGVEPPDLGRIVIEHLGVPVDAETAEGEGDPAGGRVRLEGRLRDRVGPVRLRGLEADGAAAVPRVGVEGHVGAHGLVEDAHGTKEALGVH